MQTCKYTDFGLCVKTELLKRGWEQKHLEELVSKDSGLYIDNGYPCWDAKNRDGLADELAFDYAAIAQVIPVPGGASPEPTPPVQQFGTPVETPAPFAATPAANKPVDSAHKLEDQLAQAGVPDKLRPLMVSMNVTPDELQAVVGQRGYFPTDMPVKDYPMDFVDGCLVAAWDQVAQMIVNNRDVPF